MSPDIPAAVVTIRSQSTLDAGTQTRPLRNQQSSSSHSVPARRKHLFSNGAPLRPFRLLKQDLRSLKARYISDWTLFNHLVFASAVFVFFTNLLPGITFASDLYVLTGQNYGTIEVVLSTGLSGVIFSLFSGQPLTILGVTGPLSILAENIYELCHSNFHIPFLPFMAWACIHSGWMHILLAIFNAHDWTMRYVTTFSTEVFSLLNSLIYFHKAIQELQRSKAQTSFASFLYSVIGAAGTCLLAIGLASAESWKPLFGKYIRMGLAEYAAAISIIFFIGVPHIGELAQLDQTRLAVSTSFRPTSPDRSSFIVPFWTLAPGWIFAAMVPGLIITTLFFFDHEISAIICTLPKYGVRKPMIFAWDILLLGITTALSGILGIPPANGLLPQAPLHSESLMHSSKETATVQDEDTREIVTRQEEIPRVYEQRWSHFLHAGGIMLFLSPPFMKVLGLTPTSVLAGLFLFMGEQSLAVNPMLPRLLYIFSPPSELPALPPSITLQLQGRANRGYWPIHLYTIFQVIVTGVIFGITFTKGAPIFPVIIIALVPVRLVLMRKGFLGKLWTPAYMRYVDRWACRDGHPEDGDGDDDYDGGDYDDDAIYNHGNNTNGNRGAAATRGNTARVGRTPSGSNGSGSKDGNQSYAQGGVDADVDVELGNLVRDAALAITPVVDDEKKGTKAE